MRASADKHSWLWTANAQVAIRDAAVESSNVGDSGDDRRDIYLTPHLTSSLSATNRSRGSEARPAPLTKQKRYLQY